MPKGAGLIDRRYFQGQHTIAAHYLQHIDARREIRQSHLLIGQPALPADLPIHRCEHIRLVIAGAIHAPIVCDVVATLDR